LPVRHPQDVEVERVVEPSPAAPGERVAVTLTVRNTGETTLTDIRLVDGVPTELPVADGSPRACLSLRPGEAESVEYAVVPSQGTYEFESPVTRCRSLSAAAMSTDQPVVTGATTLICRRDAGNVPQMSGSLRRVGTRPSDRGGEGLEFHSTREYRLGDGVSRVDWRRFAKNGSLATIRFTETSATETVVIVDGSADGRVARESGYPTANELAVYAADRVVARLFADGNDVGLWTPGITTGDVAVLPHRISVVSRGLRPDLMTRLGCGSTPCSIHSLRLEELKAGISGAERPISESDCRQLRTSSL